MRFTHTADCHVGGHRDPRLRVLTEKAFERFISESIEAKVDFIIISGDLFNTAIPGIDTLKFVVTQLGKAKHKDIPVYAIPGSHDFSPSGKTMLDVLEEANLLTNVCRGTITPQGKLRLSFTVDQKTGVKLTGVIGKRGMLDRHLYDDLDHSISDEPGEKIFLFHTAITELKPTHLQQMESYPVSFLPENFTYYAGGHVHIVERYSGKTHKDVVYPGPLFPNSFSELERLKHGGYYLFDDGKLIRKEIDLKPVTQILFSAEGKYASHANHELLKLAQDQDSIAGAIVLLRVEGNLRSGNPNDIDIREAVRILEGTGAYIVLRNTAKLVSADFVSVQLRSEEPREVEEDLLREHADQLKVEGFDGVALTRDLLKLLGREQHEGEKQYSYQDRVVKEALELIGQMEKPHDDKSDKSNKK